MGTHPIFESDFDCLTECRVQKMKNGRWKRSSMSDLSMTMERNAKFNIEFDGRTFLQERTHGSPWKTLKAVYPKLKPSKSGEDVEIVAEKKRRCEKSDYSTLFQIQPVFLQFQFST